MTKDQEPTVLSDDLLDDAQGGLAAVKTMDTASARVGVKSRDGSQKSVFQVIELSDAVVSS